MDPMQEILETVREIRKNQSEGLEWRRIYMRRMRVFFVFFFILLVAYIVWVFRATR
jgi:hypothetical protein